MGVADTIREQIGPMAFVMMGTKSNMWKDNNCFIFKVRGSKTCDRVKITLLSSSDTYRVEFFKMNMKTYEVSTKAFDGIYVDMLHDLIEEQTGLYLSLSPTGR